MTTTYNTADGVCVVYAGRGRQLSLTAGLVCVSLIGVAFRPPIVSMGPLLITIQHHFALSHTEASLLTAIPDLLMGVLAAPAPALAPSRGVDEGPSPPLPNACASVISRCALMADFSALPSALNWSRSHNRSPS
jgi:hypothetical protein